MSRVKRIIAAAIVLLGGGVYLFNDALHDASEADVQPMTCQEWGDKFRQQDQTKIPFYVAIKAGYVPPVYAGDYLLGVCGGGVCTIGVTYCTEELVYSFKRSPLVNGWRLAAVDGPKHTALGWKQLATDSSNDVRFFRGFKAVKARCLAHFTPAQCLKLIDGVNRCWMRPDDGNQCRGTNPGEWGLYGQIAGVGVGGDIPCTPRMVPNDKPFPCSDGGRGQRWAATAHETDFPTNEELELP